MAEATTARRQRPFSSSLAHETARHGRNRCRLHALLARMFCSAYIFAFRHQPLMKPAASTSKPSKSGSSSSARSEPRPWSAPAPRRDAPKGKAPAKHAGPRSPKHVETVMPVPNRPLKLEEKFVSDSGKARLSWRVAPAICLIHVGCSNAANDAAPL